MFRNQRMSSQIASSGLALLSSPKLVAVRPEDVDAYTVRAEDIPPDQHAVYVRGRPAATAFTSFEWLRSEIRFNNVSATLESIFDQNVDPIISRMAQSDGYCEMTMIGAAPAAQVAAFIGSIQTNKGPAEIPSKRAMCVLMKVWDRS